MTEDQKYQGHLYREKPSKANKRKSVSIVEPVDNKALVPRAAYVEDAPDSEGALPFAPSPPPAVPAKPADSVFDYLVEDDTPSQPQIAFLDSSKEEMSMKNGAPPLFSISRESSRNGYRNKEEQLANRQYEEKGYSYGAEPVNPRPYVDTHPSTLSLEFMTPAAKVTKAKLDRKERPASASHSRTNSGNTSEKKRKRDEQGPEGDTNMVDAPDSSRTIVQTPGVVHSGLTGGLHRMLSTDNDNFTYPQSPPDGNDRGRRDERRHSHATKHDDPTSPLKRTRHTKDDNNGLGISIKGRAGKVLSMVGSAFTNPVEGSVKTRRRASSSDHTSSQTRVQNGDKRERKKHKVHGHNSTSSSNVRHEPHTRSRRHGSDASRSPETTKRKVKAIEYRSESDSDDHRARRNGDGTGEMVVFGAEEKTRMRCESFLGNVTKGPESEKGYSFNKALKRWHRDRDLRHGSDKIEEEKELWRGLRLRKNDRGEIVVFF